MLSKKKKIFVLASMVVLLVVTGTLNVILNNQSKSTAADDAGGYASLFDTYRSDRMLTHQRAVLDLENLIANENASAEAKASAESMLLELNANLKLETSLEVMIKGSGFDDIFVSCSTNNINVMVKKEVLTSDEANQILDIILRETDIEATSVYVNPVR